MISIIVPVYNSEHTIARCINSVLNQSYRDWELILVNDGSSDSSEQICREFTDKDQRIKLFNKENGGVSSARNLGLRKVSGEYVTFIDSDDYIKEDHLIDLLRYLNNDIDLVCSYATIITAQDSYSEKYPSAIIDESNFQNMFVYNDMHWHTSPWGKLYKTKIITDNKLNFYDGMHIGEDAVFLFTYMLLCKKILISNSTNYCYYSDNCGSLTKRINSIKSELLSYRNISHIVDRIIAERQINSDIALSNLIWLKNSYQRRVLNSLYHNKATRKERLDTIKRFDWRDYTRVINGSLQDKILNVLVTYKMFCLYDFLRSTRSFIKTKRTHNKV